jgi:hypothetical protein
MRKYAVIGLVFAALIFASCALKGGTIEVTNGHSTYNASITILKGLLPVDGGLEQRAAPNQKVTFSIEEDGTYTVNAVFYSGSNPKDNMKDVEQKEAVLLGGNKVSVSVTTSK